MKKTAFVLVLLFLKALFVVVFLVTSKLWELLRLSFNSEGEGFSH